MSFSPLHVSVVSGAGQYENAGSSVVHLTGVLRNGTEYACQSNDGFQDGPTGATEFNAMVSNDGGRLPTGLADQ